MINYKDDLDRAGYALRDKVGQVLSSGSKILALRDRAAQYSGSTDANVVTTSNAVVSKANGLLNNYKGIENDSANLSIQANNLRAKMDTDATWQSILTDPAALLASAGWGTVAVVNSYINDAVTVISGLESLTTRANEHLNSVNQLGSDISDLDSLAQGRGITANLAKLRDAGGAIIGLGNNYLTFAKYAAIAVALFFVWDTVKPMMMTRRAD